MPGVDLQRQLNMSLDTIVNTSRTPKYESRGPPDRRGRSHLFNMPRGVIKPRAPPPSRDDRRPRDFDTQEFIKVSLNSDPKTVAGKIAHCARSDCPPTVLAIGQGCLNQAIKAVAIARKFCMQPQTHRDEAFDLSCQPAFRENSQPTRGDPAASKPSLALYLAKRKPESYRPPQQRLEMPVKSITEPTVVAGALAARVRERVDVCLTAIGVDAVGNAMRAICFARLYLEDDGLDIKAMPEFVHLEKGGNKMSGLRFDIVVETAMM